MSINNNSSAYPFHVFAGNGLGVAETIKPVSSRSYGRANLNYFANAANGNLICQDRALSFPEAENAIQFGYVFNSSSAEWHLAHGQRIKNIVEGTSITLIESDGHEINYQFNSNNKCYEAAEFTNGRPTLKQVNDTWIWFDPISRTQNEFDTNGNLVKHIDAKGNETSYEYMEGKLTAIVSPSQIRYEFKYTNDKDDKIEVYRDSEIVHTYELDTDGNLLKSVTSDNYEINYTYENKQLKSIIQTDTTSIAFKYQTDNKLSSIQVGEDSIGNVHSFTYNTNETVLTDATGVKTVFAHDGKYLTSKKEECGYETASAQDETQYETNTFGQITKITYPDQTFDQFIYDDATHFLIEKLNRDGTIIDFDYQNNLCIAQSEYDTQDKTTTPRTTYFIYDEIFKDQYAVLRYVISPTGSIKSFDIDSETGLVKTAYQYLDQTYTVDETPTLTDLDGWLAQLDANSPVKKTQYQYYDNGLIKDKTVSSGTDVLSHKTYDYDLYGHMTDHIVQCEDAKNFAYQNSYTSFGDITTKIVGLNSTLSQTTEWSYPDSRVSVVYPNQRTEITTKDSQDITCTKQKLVDDQERDHSYLSDKDGTLKMVTEPAGQTTYLFYDRQKRLGAHIEADGSVIEFDYNRQYRYQIQTGYANHIDITELAAKATHDNFAKLLTDVKDAANDRKTYTFYTANQKPRYVINPEGFLTEYQYDTQDNQTAKIVYDAKTTADELNVLLSGGTLTRTPSRQTDWISSTLWDDEHHVIAEQDPAGYLTQYDRDAGFRIRESIRYSTPVLTFTTNLNDIIPTLDADNDSHHYYFYDANDRIICEVDAQGYITTHAYYYDNKKKSFIRYEAKVTDDWFQNPTQPTPVTADNDQETNYVYDELRRLIEVHKPFNQITYYQYDEMNHRTASYTKDGNDLTNISPDACRGEESRYDAWEQVTASANPLVTQKLLEQPEDSDTIWKTQTDRTIYSETGLKIQTINPNNHGALYFYEKNNRKRPMIVIGAKGAIIEYKYNAFGEILEERKLANRLDETTLKTLSGGYLDEAISTAIHNLRDDSNDQITSYLRDRCGNITTTVDPELNTFTYNYDAIKQCLKENIPVNNNTPSLTIKHQYEKRGLEIKTTKEVTGETTQVTERLYDNLFGKCTSSTDEMLCETKQTHDRLGRVKTVERSINTTDFNQDASYTYDAFHRATTITDANQETKTIKYKDAKRTKVTKQPDGSKSKHINNVFNEVIAIIDELGNKTTQTHAANGLVDSITNPLGNTTKKKFDLTGKNTTDVDALGTKTKYEYDEEENLSAKTQDEEGLQLKTLYQSNAFHQVEQMTSPRQSVTTQTFDRLNNVKECIADANGLKVTSQFEHNALHQITSITRGDDANTNQYQEKQDFDGFNRLKTKTIDPDGLNIQTTQTLNAIGKLTKEIDARGFEHYLFRDIRQQKRFQLQPIDSLHFVLSGWTYTPSGKIEGIRRYELPVDKTSINDDTSLDDVASLAVTHESDSYVTFFYDSLDRERFKINYLYSPDTKTWQGIITEKVYDLAGHETKTVQYAALADTTTLTSTADLEATIKIITNSDADRSINHLYDAESRECFTIDQDGHVKEKRYDSVGNVIADIEYEMNLTDLNNLDINTIEGQLKTSTNDRATYHVFDALRREIFTLLPDGTLIQKDYDEENHETMNCLFKDRVEAADDYDALVTKLKALTPDPTKDSITKKEYDLVGNLIKVTDPLGNSDNYPEQDAMGNPTVHIDRNGQTWKLQYNRANQLEVEISPNVSVTTVTKTDQTLSYTDTGTELVKTTTHDEAGNTIAIVDGSNLDEKRTFIARYNPRNQLIKTELPEADYDVVTGEKNELGYYPIASQNGSITTHVLYNTRGKKIADCDENGKWSFYIRDNLDRIIYQIDKETAVTHFAYNVFGEVIDKTQFASPVVIDISQWIVEDTTTGEYSLNPMTVSWMNDHVTKSNEDRTQHFEWNRQGKTVHIEMDPIFYYIDENNFGIAKPQIKKAYNTFGDCIYTAQLIAPDSPAEKFTWLDACGRPLVEIDENNYVTRYSYNTFGSVNDEIEYAEALSVTPSIDLTKEDIDYALITSDRDRTINYTYDLSGQCLNRTQVGLIFQTSYLDNNNKPHFRDSKPSNLTQSFVWSKTGKPLSVIDEDGQPMRYYYDARDLRIGETGITRTQADTGKKLTPFTQYKLNPFGQIAVKQSSTEGGLVSDENQLPTHIIDDDKKKNEFAEEIMLYDNRGLLRTRQDAEQNWINRYYTKTRKLSREQQNAFIWDAASHIDERQILYNAFDLPIYESCRRDDINKVEDNLSTDYNAFNDVIAQYDNKHAVGTGLNVKYDTTGRTWYTNADKGANTIILRDLRGVETIRLQAPALTDDLSQQSYETLSDLLDWDAKRLERTESTRDKKGRLTDKKMPYWYKTRETNPAPTRSYQYDRWGNIIAQQDSFQRETKKDYDKRNLLIRVTRPEVDVVHEDGSTERKSVETQYGYNKRGGQIGTEDGNNHSDIWLQDEAGQNVIHVLPDGSLDETYVIDAKNQMKNMIDAKGNTWTYSHNLVGNLVEILSPSGRSMSHTVDGNGNVTSDTDETGFTIRYNNAVRGMAWERILPGGQITETVYDHNRQPMSESVQGMSTNRTWTRDFFGNPLTYKQLNGKVFTTQYNSNKEVTHRSSAGGQGRNSLTLDVKTNPLVYTPHVGDTSEQDITYNRSFGLLDTILDAGIHKITNYLYDTEGRPIYFKFMAPDGTPHQEIGTQYDEWGRDEKVVNNHLTTFQTLAHFEKTTRYDAVNNRRHESTLLQVPNTANAIISTTNIDDWSSYDENDQIKIHNGILDNNQIKLGRGKGIQYDHENGNRTCETRLMPDGSELKVEIHTDKDGLLAETVVPSTGLLVSRSRVQSGNQNTHETIPNGHTMDNIYMFDENDCVKQTDFWDDKLLIDSSVYNQFSNAGLPTHQSRTIKFLDGSDYKDDVNLGYYGFDTYVDATVTGSRVFEQPNKQKQYSDVGNTQLLYDANQSLNGKLGTGDQPPEVIYASDIYFEADSDGTILNKQYSYTLPSIIPGLFIFRNYVNYQFMQDQHHNVLGGYYSKYFDNFFSYKPPQQIVSSYVPFNHVQPIGKLTPSSNAPFSIGGWVINDYPSFSNHSPLDWDDYATNPALGVRNYYVEPGDTFESLAQKLFNDRDFAVTLARLNGMTVDQPLLTGHAIRLYDFIPKHNRSDNNSNYQVFINIIKGSLYPRFTFKPIEPKEQKDHAFLHALIKVIAMGLAIMAAPYLAAGIIEGIGIAATSGVATVITGICGAVTDAAAQGVAIGLHAQNKFSVSEMLESGINTGVLAGLGKGASLAKQVLAISIANVTEQLVEMGAGNRSKFDVTDLFEQIGALVGANAARGINANFNLTDESFLGRTVTGAAETTADVGVAVVTGHPPDVTNLAANLLGTTATNAVASAVESGSSERSDGQSNSGQGSNGQGSNGRGNSGRGSNSQSTNAQVSSAQPVGTGAATSAANDAATAAAKDAATSTPVALDMPDVTLPSAELDLSQASAGLGEINRAQMHLDKAEGSWMKGYLDDSDGYFETNKQWNQNNSSLPDFSTIDKINHALVTPPSNPFPANWNVGTRSLGLVQGIGGLAEASAAVILGTVTAETLAGPVLFGAMAASGIDNAETGLLTAITGKEQQTNFVKVAENLNIDPKLATLGQNAFDLATTLQSGSALKFSTFSGSFFAKGGDGESVNLYRAITKNELNQLMKTGTFNNPYGIERKYFSTTVEGAEQYAQMAEKAFGDASYSIVKTTMPKTEFINLARDLKEIVDRGINAVLIPTEQLSSLAKPTILERDLIEKQILNRR